MKKIVYIFSLAVAIGFASCQKSEVQTQEESSEVVFTSGISTRVTGTAWDEGDQIGVFMYNNGATAVSGSNALYTTSAGESGTYSSTDPLLYPSVGSVDFIAYHPYTTAVSDGVVSLYTTDQSTAEELKAHDFMVAAVQGCSDSDVPDLTFNRKMSKIAISVEFKETKENATLSDVSLSNVVVDGTFAISNADGARTSASIVAGSTTSDISLFYDEDSNVIEAIIIPQTTNSSMLVLLVDGDLFGVTLSDTFDEGNQYNYNLVVGNEKVELTAGDITEWDEVDDGGLIALSYNASEIDASYVPAGTTWVITDETISSYAGIKAAITAANADGREIMLVFPNLTSIAGAAFYEESNYAGTFAVQAPKVTSIGDCAFMYCKNFIGIESSEVKTIGSGAFAICSKLVSVDFPNATSIGYSAFSTCTALKTVRLTTESTITCGQTILIDVTSKPTLYIHSNNKDVENLTDDAAWGAIIYVDEVSD